MNIILNDILRKMLQWWYNFRHSKAPRDANQPIGNMYKLRCKILKSQLVYIRMYYKIIDPSYTPDWVILNGWKTDWDSI